MLKVIIGRCLIRFFTFLLLIHIIIIVQVSALYKCAKTRDVYSIHCAGNSRFGELFLHLPTTSKIPAPTHRPTQLLPIDVCVASPAPQLQNIH